MLIKFTVHTRSNPVPWAVWTSPFFFLIAGTICTLSVVYKGSPRLGLADKPAWYIASVTLGVGFGLFVLSALFFVPFVHCKVIKKDYTLKWYDIFKGPALFSRQAPADAEHAKVPDYAVMQHGGEDESEESSISEPSYDPKKTDGSEGINEKAAAPTLDTQATLRRRNIDPERNLPLSQNSQADYQILLAKATERHHAELRKKRGPIGWAMRTLHNNPMGAGSIYELHNLKTLLRRLPAMPVVACLYGVNYDIHKAQVGVLGTPEGRRMDRVYSAATKYPNEVEHLYSFVQIITACTASFAHGANDVGNAVGVWSAMYEAWSTGTAVDAKVPVKLWQIAVIALTICVGFITYGYNIMKVMGSKITYHSPSRGSSMEMGASITILIFSQYKLPVSTSMCITGATVGVGLCNGTLKAVNFQRVGLLVFSWIMTIPIAGLIGGCLMGLALNTPHFGS
jgi:sodium-dependent phosphate transporter